MKKGKIIVSILSFLLLFSCASGMYYVISNLENGEAESKIDFNAAMYEDEIFSEAIYVVADNVIKDDATPYERFAKSEVALSKPDMKYFNEMFNYMYDDLTQEPNIKYQVKNTATQDVISNVKDDLFTLINATDQKKYQKYQWFIQVDFDKDGNAKFTLPIPNQIEKENWERKFASVFNDFKANKFNDTFAYDAENYDNIPEDKRFDDIDVTLKNPANVSIVLAIPTKINENSRLYYNNVYYDGDRFMGSFVPYMLLSIVIVILYTLIVPMKYLNEMAILKNLTKIKLGFLLAVGITAESLLGVSFVELSKSIARDDFVNFIDKSWANMGNVFSFIGIVGMWIIILFVVMLAVYIIKQIFEKGLRRYFKENTILGWLYLHGSNLINKIINFDLHDSTNATVLKIVVLNFIIITVISCFFVFGFLFSFVYSVILFCLLRNKLNGVKEDYEKLLDATRKISNGEFDVDIHEDLGMFNSLRDEFTNIKDGFEKAVNEEVKSQRMKTELISNVSHDLKTPLTSIITYVDLLKNEDLSEDKRKEYIETIDRNSLRLKNLIEDLFEVSKVNSGNVKLNLIDVDIVSLIKQAYFENLDKLEEKELEFKMNFSDDKIVYHLDSSKTYRVFENLLVNISKYALAHTRVYLDIQDYEDRVVITFKNISAEEIKVDEQELTERFVQGDASRNTGGSGLGLAIAKSFVELQGGSFKLEIDGDLFKAIVVFNK